MRFYHYSPFINKILKQGFKDSTGTHESGAKFTGVWLRNLPSSDSLYVDIPKAVMAEYEWVQDKRAGYCEWLAPAALINKYPLHRIDWHT